MANLNNPKEELKNRSAQYAKYLEYGLARVVRRPFAKPSAEEKADLSAYHGKPLWELWALSQIHQYYLTQWALQQPSRPELHAVVKFLLQLEQMGAVEDARADVLCEALAAALPDAAQKQGCLAAAKTALCKLHAASRAMPYDAKTFCAALDDLLAFFPGAAVTCDQYLSEERWREQLIQADFNVSRTKGAKDFADGAVPKPLLVGVGGYGLVQLAFLGDWGMAYALKRQNIRMVEEKKHVAMAWLEWRYRMVEVAAESVKLSILTNVQSNFLLDCPYAFIDAKDLVLAVRMMPGGDLSYYLKEKKKEGAVGLGPEAVRFYIASTLLGLQALHGAGFLYRDLKDKNILLDAAGNARLCDFGLSADVRSSPASGSTGTKGFWAPEQLDKSQSYRTEPDFWTLGVCAFHWACGKLPFHASESDEVKELVKKGEYDVKTPGFKEVKGLASLCEGLLTLDPQRRLGVRGDGIAEIKKEPFFKDLDWAKLEAGVLKAPLVPGKDKINAQLPNSLKDEFSEWAEKDVPEGAHERFAAWTCTCRAVVEHSAIEKLEKDPLLFEDDDNVTPLLQPGLYTAARTPPSSTAAAAAESSGKAASTAAPTGGGCCVIA